MSKILITGGTGFIGHYLVNEFVKDHEVLCLVRPRSRNMVRLDNIKDKIKFYRHDIKIPIPDHDVFNDVDTILHAAGNPSSEFSFNNPYETVLENIVGTCNILELAKKKKVKNFVYYGAAESYGPVKQFESSKETDPYNSVSTYGATKAAGSELCIAYSNNYDIKVSILNIANTFGNMSQTNRLPVIVMKNLYYNKPTTILQGIDKSTGGRRWFHAEDVALQTRYILNNQKKINDRWNCAGKYFINNIDFANMIASAFGKELDFVYKQIERVGHESFMSISPQKLYDDGWQEPYGLQERIQHTVDWYKKNPYWLERTT